jgi:hypothetical protein
MPKVLFVCKRRPAQYGVSYGLLNSCRFLCNALEALGVEAKLVEVIDNNFIDREVHIFKPTHVFVEALWVVPEKFDVLCHLHKNVEWYVRLHSNTPFISNEGVAMEWIKKYADRTKRIPNFHIAPNSLHFIRDLKLSLGIRCLYAPNIYTPDDGSEPNALEKIPGVIDIGCFGAIRPMKNQLIQTMAAMAFADELGMKLRFHVNAGRIEQKGENAYKNMSALFVGTPHEIVGHGWLTHPEFMGLIHKMDLGLQVSFSETFNIVAADFAEAGVPCVGSAEIEWMNFFYKAKPTHIDSIISHLWLAYLGKRIHLQELNRRGLEKYNEGAAKAWAKLLKMVI